MPASIIISVKMTDDYKDKTKMKKKKRHSAEWLVLDSKVMSI